MSLTTIYVIFMRLHVSSCVCRCPAGQAHAARHVDIKVPFTMNSMACDTFHIYIRGMMAKRLRPRRPVATVLLLGLGLLGLASAACAADEVSPWDGDARSAARLIAGGRAAGQGAPLRAGIEIRLGRGWHTYWRYPG